MKLNGYNFFLLNRFHYPYIILKILYETIEPEHIDSVCQFVISGMLREQFLGLGLGGQCWGNCLADLSKHSQRLCAVL